MKMIFVLFCLIQTMFSQDLNLADFILEALNNNPGIKAKEKYYIAQKQLPDIESSLPDPVLGVTQWIEPVETRVGPQQNIFSVSQKIPFPGKLSLKEEMFQHQAREAYLIYEISKRDLIYETKTSWYDLYLTDKSIDILNKYYSLLEDFMEAAAAKYATGEGSQIQVLKAQVEYTNIQSRLLELQRTRAVLQNKLNMLRNRFKDADIPPLTHLDSLEFSDSLDELLEQAKKGRQEIAAAEERQKKARLKNKLAYKEYWPDLTIQANYITVDNKNTTAIDAGTDAWGIMLGINIPLWHSKRSAAVAESYNMVQSEEAHLKEIENSVIVEIYNNYFLYTSTAETIRLYKNELLPQAESSLQSALASYRSGRVGFLELLDSERMLLQLRLTYEKERVNYRKIIASIERAKGGNSLVKKQGIQNEN